MCAIMGYTERDIPMSRLEAAFAAAKSRGPDDSRSLEVGSGALLFRAAYDGEWFTVQFGGEGEGYVFDGSGAGLDKLCACTAE